MGNMTLQQKIIAVMFVTSLLSSTTLLTQETQAPSQTQNIANAELESVEPVEFINYVGPHDRVDSLASIIAIGTQLANLDEQGTSNYAGKYSIQHISDGGQMLDADILSFSSSAGVDHIRNLRHIISGYLQARYNYPSDDANTISMFITYYNAFYRQNTKYFQQKFAPEVNNTLYAESIGLSTNYADWPGATQIIIPLSANPIIEQPASLNLDESGQNQVSQYLDEQEKDKEASKDIRENMLDLRQEKLNNDQELLEQKESELQKENKDMQNNLKIAQTEEAATNNMEVREAAQKEQQELKEQLQDNQKSQNELEAVQQTIAQRQENLNKEQRKINLEEPPPKTEIKEQAELLSDSVVFLLPVANINNRFFQFYAANNKSLEIVKRSEINSIRNMQFVTNDIGYVAVAGKYNITETPPQQGKDNNSSIRLVLIGKDLNYQNQGDDNINAASGVWQHNGEIFAFLKNGTLGRFNQKLELLAESIDKLKLDFPPQFSESHVLVENLQQEMVWLKLDTLQRTKVLVR